MDISSKGTALTPSPMMEEDIDDMDDDPEPEENEIDDEDPEEIKIDPVAITALETADNDNEWPRPFVDTFELPDADMKWPKLDTKSKDEVMKWIFINKSILIRTVTWNMHAKKPPSKENINRVLLPLNKFHMVIVGSEECERSITQSAVNPSKKNWEAYLREALGSNYIPLRAQTLQAMHIIVFVHIGIRPNVLDIFSGAIATGMANTLGNKGGVGVSFKMGNSKFAFLNCHLAAHQHGLNKRNLQMNKIDKEMCALLFKNNSETATSSIHSGLISGDLNVAPDKLVVPPVTATSSAAVVAGGGGTSDTSTKLIDVADIVFIMGDLNYRVRGNRSIVDKLIQLRMRDVLLVNDQLRWSMDQGLVLSGYHEAEIKFLPTYKFDKNSDTYDSGPKKRIPGWTDRIVFKGQNTTCLAYDSEPNIRTSDHRPVFASFICHVDVSDDSPTMREDQLVDDFSSNSQICSIM